MSEGETKRNAKLTDREEFQFVADLVFKHSRADHTLLTLKDGETGTTRFANSQIVQNVHLRRVTLSVTVAFGQQHGTASTTDLSAGAVQEVLRRAERSAAASPADPEYLPPLGPQLEPDRRSWEEDTATAGPQARLEQAHRIIQLCRQEDLAAAGIVSTTSMTVGVAANTGLQSFEPRTEAAFSVTAIGGSESGWSANRHRSLGRLGIAERTQTAIRKAKQSADPKEIPPGRYLVILEPAAVAGLISRVLWDLDARRYYRHTSPFSGRLGLQVMDPRLTLRNIPGHRDLLGSGFNNQGVPADDVLWIGRGILHQLQYDRYTAQSHRVAPSPDADAPQLIVESEEGGKPKTLEDLIQQTDRGVLVTNFWYIRTVNPTDLTLTGMTRDGTFFIEEGRVKEPVRNFRFHESPLRALAHLEGHTNPLEAASAESGKMLVPALKLPDFNFSSVTRF